MSPHSLLDGHDNRTICVVGTGYVGMAGLIGFAELGHHVRGYDVDGYRIARLREGCPPYSEPGIEASLMRHLSTRRLTVFDDLEEAVEGCRYVVLAVGTPAQKDGSTDLSALLVAIEALAEIRYSRRPVFVIRSTIPPGTSGDIARRVAKVADVLYVPEFLREGSAIRDFLNPDRIVVGTDRREIAERFAALFSPATRPVLITSWQDAELIKYCSNAFLALKISFANEVARLCDALGGTVDDVLRGVGADRRIGSECFRPGLGFGGPCLEKDIRSIENVADQLGVTHELFSATLRVNRLQPQYVISILESELGTSFGKTIGVWGLAFKPGTDDVRNSLALLVVNELVKRGARCRIFDPAVKAATLPPNTELMSSALAAAEADALVVLTDWAEFAAVDPIAVRTRLRKPIVVDGRNVLDRGAYLAAGVRYRGVGRPGITLTDADDLPEPLFADFV